MFIWKALTPEAVLAAVKALAQPAEAPSAKPERSDNGPVSVAVSPRLSSPYDPNNLI